MTCRLVSCPSRGLSRHKHRCPHCRRLWSKRRCPHQNKPLPQHLRPQRLTHRPHRPHAPQRMALSPASIRNSPRNPAAVARPARWVPRARHACGDECCRGSCVLWRYAQHFTMSVVWQPTRVSTAVCRAAAERAKAGTALGAGLHARCLQHYKDDPAVSAVRPRCCSFRVSSYHVGGHSCEHCAGLWLPGSQMFAKQQRVDLSKCYDDADDLLDSVATWVARSLQWQYMFAASTRRR